LAVHERPFVGAAPLLPRRLVVRVVVDLGLVHHVVLDALQPVIKEAVLLDRDVKPRVRLNREPCAVGRRTYDHLVRRLQVVEREEGPVLRSGFIPVGGDVDGDARLVDLIQIGVRTRFDPPRDGNVRGHAVAERDVTGVCVLGDGGVQLRVADVAVDGHGRWVPLRRRAAGRRGLGVHALGRGHAAGHAERIDVELAAHRKDGLELRRRRGQRLHLASTRSGAPPHAHRARAPGRPRSTGVVQFCEGTRHREWAACPVRLALMSRFVRYREARRPRSPTPAIEMSSAFGDRLSCIWGQMTRRRLVASYLLRFGYGPPATAGRRYMDGWHTVGVPASPVIPPPVKAASGLV
jgi:hypothetical protein